MRMEVLPAALGQQRAIVTLPAPELLAYRMRFTHPEKTLAGPRGAERLGPEILAPLFGITPDTYREVEAGFEAQNLAAASALLEDAPFAELVAHLPFAPDDVVVGLGDSLTDDRLSWFELLRQLLTQQRGSEAPEMINAGISGDITAQLLSRSLAVTALEPTWFIVLIGTNDARRHGWHADAPLVSAAETRRNLRALRRTLTEHSEARRLWMTPPPVIEGVSESHWLLTPQQVWFRNIDLERIAVAVRGLGDPVVDLATVIGRAPDAELFMDDGIHLSQVGHQQVVRACVARLIDTVP